MADRIVFVVKEHGYSGLFGVDPTSGKTLYTIYVDGRKIGQVYEVVSGRWLSYAPKQPQGHPTIEEAIKELLETNG